MKAFFLKRYKKLKPDFSIEACSVRPALRINTLKIDPKQIIGRLQKEKVKLVKVPFLKYGYHYYAPFSLGSTPEYLLGYYYLQEAASQAAAELLDPKDGDDVLDMAAAPGSKTTYLAQLMNNTGTIVAIDKVKWRLLALRNNIERMGVTNTIIYNKDARYISDFKATFNKILLDAPCSGNFLLENDWFSKRTLEDIKHNAKVQKELLSEGFNCLRKGGSMVYSTCSLEPEENEDVIAWGKKHIEGFDLIKEKRYWPDETGTQGFFTALIKKG